ncbi:Uncharacterized protein OBRU01_24882 [Operophtera brumata]|uniref:Uncharacterized protein n=1 Tax=Operophtera brumata TaxID=104452 RepID=A0A0L7KK31_OPEBR|nr:Uncharacterized protein OBRU01_24882 [Operophtera brumata]
MAEVNRCVICVRSVLRRRHHVLSLEFLESHRDFVEYMFGTLQQQQEIIFDGSRSICHPCWQRIDYGLRHPPEQEAPPMPPTETFCVSGLTRAANTSRRCMIDDCNNLELRSVSGTIKAYLLSYYRFYIPPLARICQHHLRTMTWEDFSQNVTQRQDSFNGGNIHDMLDIYTQLLERKKTA